MRSRIGLCLVCLLVGASTLLVVQPAQGGNDALMKAWQSRRQELSQKIADHLAKEQRLPQNGVVRYTARVKPDPAAPGGLLLAVDNVSVVPSGAPAARVEGQAASQDMDAAFAPRDPGLSVRLQSLDVPVGATVQGSLTIRNGKPVPPSEGGPAAATDSAAQAATPPAAPAEEPSLLKRLFDALGW